MPRCLPSRAVSVAEGRPWVVAEADSTTPAPRAAANPSCRMIHLAIDVCRGPFLTGAASKAYVIAVRRSRFVHSWPFSTGAASKAYMPAVQPLAIRVFMAIRGRQDLAAHYHRISARTRVLNRRRVHRETALTKAQRRPFATDTACQGRHRDVVAATSTRQPRLPPNGSVAQPRAPESIRLLITYTLTGDGLGAEFIPAHGR